MKYREIRCPVCHSANYVYRNDEHMKCDICGFYTPKDDFPSGISLGVTGSR